MRTDGHDASRFVPRAAMPAVGREAHRRIGALAHLTAWLGRLRGERAHKAMAAG